MTKWCTVVSFLMLWKVWILENGELRCLCQEPGNRMGLLTGRCCCDAVEPWWDLPFLTSEIAIFDIWPPVTLATFCHQLTLVPWGPQERRDYEEIERYAALRCRSPFMVWAECGRCCWSLVATVARFVAIFLITSKERTSHIKRHSHKERQTLDYLITDCLLYCSLLYPVVINAIFNVNPYPEPTVKTPYSPLPSMPGMGSVNPWGMECLIFNSSGKAMAAPLKHVSWSWPLALVSLTPAQDVRIERRREPSARIPFNDKGCFCGSRKKIPSHRNALRTGLQNETVVQCIWVDDRNVSISTSSGEMWDVVQRRLPPVESWEGLRPSMNTSYEVRRSTMWSPYHRCLCLCCKHHCGIMVGGVPRDQYEPSRAHRLWQETERPSQEELRSTSTWKDAKPVFSGTFGFATSCGGSKPGAWWPCPAGCSLVAIAVAFVQGEINLHVRSAPVTCSVASVSGVDYQ